MLRATLIALALPPVVVSCTTKADNDTQRLPVAEPVVAQLPRVAVVTAEVVGRVVGDLAGSNIGVVTVTLSVAETIDGHFIDVQLYIDDERGNLVGVDRAAVHAFPAIVDSVLAAARRLKSRGSNAIVEAPLTEEVTVGAFVPRGRHIAFSYLAIDGMKSHFEAAALQRLAALLFRADSIARARTIQRTAARGR